MTDPTPPLLDIQTLAVRPVIEIDGTRYEMLSPGELSVAQSVRLVGQARQIAQLQDAVGQADEDPDAVAKLEQLATDLASAVLGDVPEEVLAKLSGMHKIRIAEVFTVLLLRDRLEAAGAMPGIDLIAMLTGGNAFPGSSGSTAAAPANGWRTRLSRWLRLT